MTPDIESSEEGEPRRSLRRRRKRAGGGSSEAAHASEAPRSDESEAVDEPVATRGASAADATPADSADGQAEAVVASSDVDPQAEVEQTPEDVEAEEAAADVMLEADAEAEGEADSENDDSENDDSENDESEDEDDESDEDEDEEPEAETPGTGTSRRLPLRRRRKGSQSAEPPPAPARRRSRREPGAPIPVVRAQAKYVRSSARKARLVCDHIRGKSVEEARAILALTPRAIAKDWSKLLESAVANAEHNHELVGEDLYVKAVHADEGPTIKRFRPRAMGRATRIRKRTSHLTILLTPKE
jgi:ribosomal protein L22